MADASSSLPIAAPTPSTQPAGWLRVQLIVYGALLSIALGTGWQHLQGQRILEAQTRVAEAEGLTAQALDRLQAVAGLAAELARQGTPDQPGASRRAPGWSGSEDSAETPTVHDLDAGTDPARARSSAAPGVASRANASEAPNASALERAIAAAGELAGRAQASAGALPRVGGGDNTLSRVDGEDGPLSRVDGGGGPLPRAGDGGRARLNQARQRVQDARAPMVEAGAALLAQVRAGRPQAAAAAAPLLLERTEQLRRQAVVLQGVLRERGDALRAQQASAARRGGGAMLALLALALIAAVPALRSLRVQSRRLAQRAADHERLAAAAEHTGHLVLVTDPEGRIVWVNRAFTRVSGYESQQAVGRHLRELLFCDCTDAQAVERLEQAVAGGAPAQASVLHRARDGSLRWIAVDVAPLRNVGGELTGFVSAASEITEQVTQQLRDSARRDPLTRLPNRGVVLERVQRAIEHRRRNPGYGFALLFMDIDRFKQVNDTLGHAAGDELLCQVAARVEETLRPGDAIARVDSELRTAARVGGDEFVIVLEGIRHLDEACTVAERLLQAVAQPYRVGPHPVQVSASLGIVGAGQAGEDAAAVLRDGDTAMYEAKRAGRGRWVMFDASMHERLRAAQALEGDLREALARDALDVAYQPLVELPSRRLVGVEALARWHHAGHGDIPPLQFIPLAEECGLIDALGMQVLAKACAQFARWRARWGERAPALLAVNLSYAQLGAPGLVPEVLAVLQAHGMRPQELQFEVTESATAHDLQVQATLRGLKTAGVRLALDGFGTGYSSLASLHQLPVDTVKIDRSFVAHAHDVEYQRVLVTATVRVARALGMTTVAAGIETEAQAALMAELACDRGQGWLFGRPMQADALDRWIEAATEGSIV